MLPRNFSNIIICFHFYCHVLFGYAGIRKINDIFDTQENCFLSFDSFCNKFNVRFNFLQYFSLVNAISQSWKKLLNCSLEQGSTPQIVIEEMTCKNIYSKLVSLRSKSPRTDLWEKTLKFRLPEGWFEKIISIAFWSNKRSKAVNVPAQNYSQYPVY